VGVPKSVSSGGPTEGISISDQAVVSGEKRPVPVLRLRDDVDRANMSRRGSASSSSSGTAFSTVASCMGTAEGAKEDENGAGHFVRAHVSWTILSSSHSVVAQDKSSASEPQPTGQPTSSTAAMV
jgi:hypothetical protein